MNIKVAAFTVSEKSSNIPVYGEIEENVLLLRAPIVRQPVLDSSLFRRHVPAGI